MTTKAFHYVENARERQMIPVCRHGDYVVFLRASKNEKEVLKEARYTHDSIEFSDGSEAVRVSDTKHRWGYQWQVRNP